MPTSLLLLAAVVAYLLFYIGRRVLAGLRHPNDEDLVHFYNDTLAPADRALKRSIAEHLGHCEACRDRLDELIKRKGGGPGSEAPLISRRY